MIGTIISLHLMRSLLLFAFILSVCADELSNRAVIQDAFNQLDAAAPEPVYDPTLMPRIMTCLTPKNGLSHELCTSLIQQHYDFLLAQYTRRYVTDTMTDLLDHTPQPKVMNFDHSLIK